MWVAAAPTPARDFLREEHQTLGFFSFVLRFILPVNVALLVWGEFGHRQMPASLAGLLTVAAALLAHATVLCYLRLVCRVPAGRVGVFPPELRGEACGHGRARSCRQAAAPPPPYDVRLPSRRRPETLPGARRWSQQ